MSYSRTNLGRVLAFCSLLVATTAWAAIAPIYVSTTGNDSSGDGSLSRPYRTIAKGIGSLRGGGTLYLRGGVYAEPGIQITESHNGPSSTEKTIIASYPGERAIFKPTSHTQHGLYSSGSARLSNLLLSGFTIDFSNKDIEAQGRASIANLKFFWATNLVLTNMWFLNNTNGSLTQVFTPTTIAADYGPGGNVLVTSCLFSNVTRQALSNGYLHNPCHSMYWNSMRDVVIERSVFLQGHSYGIHIYGGNRVTNVVVRNNYLANFSNGMFLSVNNGLVYNNILVDISSVALGHGSQYTMYANNTIYSEQGTYGIRNTGYADSFVNNLIWGNLTWGVLTSGETNRPSYWTNNIAPSALWTAGNPTRSGNLIGSQYDPQFVKPPHDMGLGANSAAAGKGVNLQSVFAHDQLGRDRPSTGAWDIGALISDGSSLSQRPGAPQGFTGGFQ